MTRVPQRRKFLKKSPRAETVVHTKNAEGARRKTDPIPYIPRRTATASGGCENRYTRVHLRSWKPPYRTYQPRRSHRLRRQKGSGGRAGRGGGQLGFSRVSVTVGFSSEKLPASPGVLKGVNRQNEKRTEKAREREREKDNRYIGGGSQPHGQLGISINIEEALRPGS